MIAFVDRAWTGEIANRLRGVGRYHASRMVVLSYEPSRRSLDARVTISRDGASSPGELSLLRETVVVELGDVHLDDLLTIADPLVVTDLPTLLWSPHGHREVLSELLPLSQAVLLDSVEEPDPGRGAAVGPPARRGGLRRGPRVAAQHALARARGRDLRSADPAAGTAHDHRPDRPPPPRLDGRGAAADGLARLAARVARSHPAGPRPGAPRPRPRQPPGRRAAAAGRTRADGARAGERLDRDRRRSLAAARPRGSGGLRAHARQADGGELDWTLPGASRGEGGVLGEGIRQALLRDPTYVPALDAALAMAG